MFFFKSSKSNWIFLKLMLIFYLKQNEITFYLRLFTCELVIFLTNSAHVLESARKSKNKSLKKYGRLLAEEFV